MPLGNEALFRAVNEEIETLSEQGERPIDPLRLVCECSEPTCTTTLDILFGDYEDVRGHPLWFRVIPGHEDPAVEHVVARHSGYIVVAKDRPATARIAARTDPRG